MARAPNSARSSAARDEIRGDALKIFTVISLISALVHAPITPAQTSTRSAKTEEPTLESVLALKDPSLPGKVVTYYTHGYKNRARLIQAFLTEERDFYARELNIQLPLTVAVLDAKQWERLNILDPYGVPTVTDFPPYVALLPANWSQNHLGMLPPPSQSDPALVRRVHAAGSGWSDIFYQGFDAIIGHEFGHAAARTYGIRPPTHWFDEFLATYFEIAFVRQRRADLQFPVEIFFAINRNYPHPYTSLSDFESRYPLSNTSPTNYAWYQAMFEQRIEQVYSEQGIEFLREVREIFPADKPQTLSNSAVLEQLERICPGFIAWSRMLETTVPTQQ